MVDTFHTPSSRANLDAAYEAVPLHLKPVIKAVRDHRCGLLFVRQSAEPFRLPDDPGRPAIVLIGDDMHCAVGPNGFHIPSLRRTIRACTAFAVISSAPQPDAYSAIAAMAALTRRNVMIIETRIEEELPWMALIQKLAPKRFIWLATVEGGNA